MTTRNSHLELIVDQFTRQATPFADKPEHRDTVILDRLVRFAGVRADDEVLDVACGPGLLSCAAAVVARRVTGLDVTPAMLDRARGEQASRGLQNVSWEIGDATALPYPDASFSVVMTRYSFHHFTDPAAACREMVRVCRPGGTVLVVDVALPPEKATAYDRFERHRDPSHTQALTLDEFPALARAAGLHDLRTDFYRLEMELEKQIAASFPAEGDGDRLRGWLRDDLEKNEFGLDAERRGGAIWFSYPTLALAGRK